MNLQTPAILIDTREQLPWEFNHPTAFLKLNVGDYSIAGLENSVVIERKRHEELINCLGNDRDRFLREIERGEYLRRLHVIVEGSFKAVIECLYESWGSEMHPNAIRGTIAAWCNRYDWLRFWFCGDRFAAQIWAEHLLKRTWADAHEGKQP